MTTRLSTTLDQVSFWRMCHHPPHYYIIPLAKTHLPTNATTLIHFTQLSNFVCNSHCRRFRLSLWCPPSIHMTHCASCGKKCASRPPSRPPGQAEHPRQACEKRSTPCKCGLRAQRCHDPQTAPRSGESAVSAVAECRRRWVAKVCKRR